MLITLLRDLRVIDSVAGYQVLAEAQTVTFRDGSTATLHPVRLQGTELMFLRALPALAGRQWLVLDLRQLVPGIEADVLALPPCDTPGLIFYGLRLGYPDAAALERAARAVAAASWWSPALEEAAA